MSLADLRRDYTLAGLNESDLAPNPFDQFQRWFQEAVEAGITEPNAMILATVDSLGQPSTRTVLLKGVDPRGFSFFTNYQSRKGQELAANPAASLTFPWIDLERQICIRGRVDKLPRVEAVDYFRTRPRGSRLGAWASNQSQVISSRANLEARMHELEEEYPNPTDDILPPDSWGGYVLAPVEVEFWQGRSNRLHDRLRFVSVQSTPNSWQVERVAP